jgi:hypothetical protein
MKPRLVSAVAVLFCCAVLAVVGLFGYSRYEAAQAANAAFRQQLLNPPSDNGTVLGTHMPAELPPRSTSAAPPASPEPQQ